MRKIYTALLLLTILANFNFAQVRKIVLLEEATNASCPDCSVLGPALHEMIKENFGTILPLQYHAWWPGADPMYSLNTSQNSARINYYSYNYVPITSIDGKFYGEPVDAEDILANAEILAADESMVELKITDLSINSDSIFFYVNYKSFQNYAENYNLKLYTAIVEREINYSTSPGTNGMTDFAYVMRELIPSSSGFELGVLESGKSGNVRLSTTISDAWNQDELDVVCWIQSDVSKEILQSATSIPLFDVESNETALELIEPNSEVIKNYSIKNENDEKISVRIKPIIKTNTGNWEIKFDDDQNAFTDSLDAEIFPGATYNFKMSVSANNTNGLLEMKVFAQNLFHSNGYGNSLSFTGWMGSGKILIIDNDGGANKEERYINSFQNFNLQYEKIDADLFAVLFAGKTSLPFELVLFHNAERKPNQSADFFNVLKGYLNNGGKLIVSGQDFGSDIFLSGGGSNSESAKDFYNNYLGAGYVANSIDNFAVKGIEGSEISNGINFNLNTIYPKSTDLFEPNIATSFAVFKIGGTDSICAVANKTDNYQTFYSSFSPEQIIPSSYSGKLIESLLNWFGLITTEIGDSEITKMNYNLYQNYPNPFNPSTVIKYSIQETGLVRLIVYDILGNEITQLVNEIKAPGNYETEFNLLSNKRLSSGVYIYKLNINGKTFAKKMLMLK